MRYFLLVAVAATSRIAVAAPETTHRALVEGYATLPLRTFTSPPDDAPPYFGLAGRYAVDRVRHETRGSIRGHSFVSSPPALRLTDVLFPVAGQPVQGFSSIRAAADGTFFVLSDNGFGGRNNSADSLLMLHRVAFDWRRRAVEVKATLFFHDPDRILPFPITNEATARRYLTGADLDFESLEIVDGDFWLGDELGPFLVRADARGKLLAVYPAEVGGRVVRSADNFQVVPPSAPGPTAFEIERSHGLEGLARSPVDGLLWALFEGPVFTGTEPERAGGKKALRLIAFDPAQARFTGASHRYCLEDDAHSIGELTFLPDGTALVIERDNGEGDASLACNGAARTDCFNSPARTKILVRIDLRRTTPDGCVRRIARVDLLDLVDPKRPTRPVSFPYVTIESVLPIDAERVIVANDNNFGLASGRKIGAADDTEVLLLRVPELLRPIPAAAP